MPDCLEKYLAGTLPDYPTWEEYLESKATKPESEIPVKITEQKQSNEIMISGNVGTPIGDVPVTILIKNQVDDLIQVVQVTPDESGQFSYIIKKDGLIWEKTTSYLVDVKYMSAQTIVESKWITPKLIQEPVKSNNSIKQIQTISSDPVLAKKITESNNQFTFNFYKQISKEKNENIFFSSPSISTAFSILYEGAKEDTAVEIQKVFGFPTDYNERQLGFISFINMMNQKNNDENTIQMSNALWLANGFTPLPEYINTAMVYYNSSVDTVNFATDEGRLEINDWVKSKTQDRIEELLVPGSITSLTKMVITNTIYFKGLWEYPFELENTYDGDFVVDPTNTVTVPMMTYDHKMNLNYISTDQMQMLQMPYRGNSFSMLIILPHDAVKIQSVEDSLTLDNLELWKSQLGDLRGINIHIPKFTLDTEYNLKKILPDMGISLVFGPADLSGITGYKGLFVSEAVHKAFVEVNELGTEAAAATAINLNESGGVLFKADHPFIFLIQDNISNDILFIGKIVDPTK